MIKLIYYYRNSSIVLDISRQTTIRVIQVGFAQSAALKKLANRNVFRQHRSFSFRSRFCTNIFFTFWYIFVPGVPPEPSQGCQSEAQWWQVCPDPLFHRFFIVFGIHFGRRFLTCCSVWGIQFRNVFLEASRDALVRISVSFWEPFRKHFGCVFRNRPHADFDDPSYAKAMI